MRAEYQGHLDKQRSRLQTEAATIQAFKSKALDAVHDPADEHEAGFHYYSVAIDKAALVHGLYLTERARESLSQLSSGLSMQAGMERFLAMDNPHSAIEESAEGSYKSGIAAVETCRMVLMQEFGLVG